MDRLRPGLLTGLPLVLLLGGCFGDIDMAPFGRSDAISAPDSLTTRRVMGTATDVPPLEPEPGNVWPAEEAPRATLQNPDVMAPQSAIPSPPLDRAREQRGPAPGAPRLQSETERGPGLPPEAAPNPRAPAPGTATPRRRGSSEALPPLEPQPVPRAGVPLGAPATPPPPRAEGQVIPVPGGPPATITGSAGNIQTYTQPGIGTGTAIRQNGSTMLIQPDGTTVVVPTPR